MSYEHCDKHDMDATNGCEGCFREEVEEVVDTLPRPLEDSDWHPGARVEFTELARALMTHGNFSKESAQAFLTRVIVAARNKG